MLFADDAWAVGMRDDQVVVSGQEANGRGRVGIRSGCMLDGFVAGTWRTAKKGARETLTIEPFLKLKQRDRKQLDTEGEHLLAFIAGDAAGGGVIDDPS